MRANAVAGHGSGSPQRRHHRFAGLHAGARRARRGARTGAGGERRRRGRARQGDPRQRQRRDSPAFRRRDPGPRRGRSPERPDRRVSRRALPLHHHPPLPRDQSHRRRAPGAGRGRRLRPRPARALLRCRPAVPVALQADPVGRAGGRASLLPALGHRVEGRPRHALDRRIDPLRQARHHDSHGAARIPLRGRRPGAVQGPAPPLPQACRRRLRPRFRRGQAGRARRAPSAEGRFALCRRAQRQGGQGRPARPAHAVLDRQVPLPRRSGERAGRPRRAHEARIPPLRPRLQLPVDGALPASLPRRALRGAPDPGAAAGDRPPARLSRPPRRQRRRALHEALLPDGQDRRRPDAHLLRRAGGAAPPQAAAPAPELRARRSRDRRFRRAAGPPQAPRGRRLHPRPGQADRPVPRRRPRGLRHPSGRAAPDHPQPGPYRPPAARRRRGQPPVPRAPDLAPRPGNGAPADERGRRARPLRSRLRARGRADAVRHVPRLHRRRARHPRDRHPEPDREGRAGRRVPAGFGGDPQRHLAARALPGAVPARHRQGTRRQPLREGRDHRARAGSPARADGGGGRDGRLAGALPPGDEPHRLQARPPGSANRGRLRRPGAEPRAAPPAAGPDRGRHPRRRPRALERVEGSAAGRALPPQRGSDARRQLAAGGPGERRARSGEGPLERRRRRRVRPPRGAVLPRLLAGRGARIAGPQRAPHAPRRPPPEPLRLRCPRRPRRRRHRGDPVHRRPARPVRPHRRGDGSVRRRHRRRQDHDHDRRHGARLLRRPGPGRGRGRVRGASRGAGRPHRGGFGRAARPRPGAGAAHAAAVADGRLRGDAPGADRQPGERAAHRGRDQRARPAAPAARRHERAGRARPRHRQRPHPDLRGARRRRVLPEEPVRSEDREGGAARRPHGAPDRGSRPGRSA